MLKALGVGDELAHSSIRFGLGRFNTEEEVDLRHRRRGPAVNHLREMSPLYEMAQAGHRSEDGAMGGPLNCRFQSDDCIEQCSNRNRNCNRNTTEEYNGIQQ